MRLMSVINSLKVGKAGMPPLFDRRMGRLGYLLLVSLLASQVSLAQSRVTSNMSWPRPIPARIRDSDNKDLMVMTLGDVKTVLADGVFDPVKDEVRLNDGTVRKNYYKVSLGIKYFQPIDK